MECVQSYITKLECLNGDCVQYSMKHCIPKNKYEGTQRLEELFMPFAPLTVTEQFPISYMDIGEYHDDENIKESENIDVIDSEEEEEEEDIDEVQQDVCSQQMIDNLLDSLEVKHKSTSNETKKSKKQQKNKSKKKKEKKEKNYSE